jgi:hypothetical protein
MKRKTLISLATLAATALAVYNVQACGQQIAEMNKSARG